MARAPFYHATTKKIIVAFATIFDEIQIVDDYGRTIAVPLIFSQKEKFIDAVTSGADYDMDDATYDIMFPKMGFEVTGFNFAPERHTNPIHQMLDTNDDGEEYLMYNRVPYDVTFDLFVGAKKLNDSLKVVEQIVPFFNPELTLTIKDKEEFQLETNIPIVLNSVALNIDYEGSLDTKRTILWTLNFTAKAYYYPDIRETTRIKNTVMNFTETDFERVFERLTASVVPQSAGPDDPHIIVETKEVLTNE